MEKTLARAIYKRMEIGKRYTSYDLYRLLGEDEYYKYVDPTAPHEDVRKVVGREMWKVANAGYAKTELVEEKFHCVRGLKYHNPNRDWSKIPQNTYTTRYWTRVK